MSCNICGAPLESPAAFDRGYCDAHVKAPLTEALYDCLSGRVPIVRFDHERRAYVGPSGSVIAWERVRIPIHLPKPPIKVSAMPRGMITGSHGGASLAHLQIANPDRRYLKS